MECAIGTCCAKGTVYRVETYCVDGVDVADVAGIWGGLTVTFEAEIGRGVFLLNVLDRAAPFYRADCVSRRICEASDYPCLPFERGLLGLVEFCGFIEVHNVDVAVRCADDEKLILGVDAVDAFLTVHRGDGVGLPEIPVFDGLVPASCY